MSLSYLYTFAHFATQPPKLQLQTKIHEITLGAMETVGEAWQQVCNKFTDIRGFFHPILTSFFRGSQPFGKENLISASSYLVTERLASLKVLVLRSCQGLGKFILEQKKERGRWRKNYGHECV